MIFPYSSRILIEQHTGQYLVVHRPEIPITISGPHGTMALTGLVDTGSDYTLFPKSVADLLGIDLQESSNLAAKAFGGQSIPLSTGVAMLGLRSEQEFISWTAEVDFFEFGILDAESVILGHYGFLEFFTAVFDGRSATLSLIPNEDLPHLEIEN